MVVARLAVLNHHKPSSVLERRAVVDIARQLSQPQRKQLVGAIASSFSLIRCKDLGLIWAPRTYAASCRVSKALYEVYSAGTAAFVVYKVSFVPLVRLQPPSFNILTFDSRSTIAHYTF
jgi:hypothetical protein